MVMSVRMLLMAVDVRIVKHWCLVPVSTSSQEPRLSKHLEQTLPPSLLVALCIFFLKIVFFSLTVDI